MFRPPWFPLDCNPFLGHQTSYKRQQGIFWITRASSALLRVIYILDFVFRSSSVVVTSFGVLYVFWFLYFFRFHISIFCCFVLCTFRALYHSQRLCSATFERGAAGPSVSVIHTHVSYPPLLVAIFVFYFVFCILRCIFCIDCHHCHHDHWPATRFKIPWQPIKAFNCWLIGNQSAAPPYDCTCGQGNIDQFAQKYLFAAMEIYVLLNKKCFGDLK